MKRLVLSLGVLSALAACGRRHGSHTPPPNHLAPTGEAPPPPVPEEPLPPPDPWEAPEVRRESERMLVLMNSPQQPRENEVKIDNASPGKTAVDFFFESPTDGRLRIQNFSLETMDCETPNVTRSVIQLVSSSDHQDVTANEVINVEPRAYRLRVGLDNVGACQGLRVRFFAAWDGPRPMAATDNYRVPPPPPPRRPLTDEAIANPMLKAIDNTDEGTFGACVRKAIIEQAPPQQGQISHFQSQPQRDDTDPSVTEYVYFTMKGGEQGQPNSRFLLKIQTSDGQSWRYIYDGFTVTAYASSMLLKAKVREADTGKMGFDVDLSACKDLIPRMDVRH